MTTPDYRALLEDLVRNWNFSKKLPRSPTAFAAKMQRLKPMFANTPPEVEQPASVPTEPVPEDAPEDLSEDAVS